MLLNLFFLTMALPKNNFSLRPERLEKGGRKNPFLSIDNVYEFTAFKVNRNETVWTYVCRFRMTYSFIHFKVVQYAT